MLYFSTELWTIVQVLLRKLGRLPVNEKDLTVAYALLLGTIPAVVAGVLIESFFGASEQSAAVIATLLLSVSIFFMYVEWRYYLRPSHESITPKLGLLVGFFQSLAIIPGFSRSGATIAGGMLLGLSRLEAVRFSFLLAVPLTLGVGIKEFVVFLRIGGEVNWLTVSVGAIIAAVTSLVVIRIFLEYVRNHTLWPFIWYNVILAFLVGYIALIA
jgi:undecaprenyl-diphosphatase